MKLSSYSNSPPSLILQDAVLAVEAINGADEPSKKGAAFSSESSFLGLVRLFIHFVLANRLEFAHTAPTQI
ncbi:hypothetical protein H5410_020270 [Solanum commersonii]|uniref:Uncharacterized protein n=1 Tax=Solanum commersonii TaxID=4109 RepID=A0A9J5Z9L6_SOLCO|nr:hypothetical protein H5410_020270 [Solanum commersonii]